MSVVKLNRAIQYRAYPTEEQAVLLGKTFGCVRFVWNHTEEYDWYNEPPAEDFGNLNID